MFGDIITDLAGILQGGMGVAAGGNINPEPGGTSMFEPMGGSAPKYTGKGVINPIARSAPPPCCSSSGLPDRGRPRDEGDHERHRHEDEEPIGRPHGLQHQRSRRPRLRRTLSRSTFKSLAA
jgi:hypothetical protein